MSPSAGISKKKPRQARHVLTEEEYTETLSNIITRDYFPAIPSLQRDVAILDRRKEGDMEGAVTIRRAARQLASHEEELARIEQETEEYAAQHDQGIRGIPRPLHRETVDGFHARVTSEDNEEFERQMRKEIQDRNAKMTLIYNSVGVNASKVSDALRIMNQHHSTLNTDNHDDNDNDDNKSCAYASDIFNPPKAIVHVAGTTKDGQHSTSFTNSLFFTPLLESSVTTHSYQSTFPAHTSEPTIVSQPSIHPSTALLMPPPNSLRKTTNTTADRALTWIEDNNIGNNSSDMSQMNLVEYIAKPSHDKEKRIVPSQTRFPYQSVSKLSHSLSSSMTHDTTYHRADSYSEVESSSDYNPTDLDEPVGSIDFERRQRKRKLDRERNTLVAMTPLIIPGQELYTRDTTAVSLSNHGNSSPIMTWGQVASTPMVVGGSSSVAITTNLNLSHDNSEMKTFVFAKEDPNEKMARIAEAALAKKAQRYKEASTSRTKALWTDNDEISVNSSSTRASSSHAIMSRLKTLTPKAQLLLKGLSSSSKNSSSITTPRSRSAFGTALRESYGSILSTRHKDKDSRTHTHTKNISLKDTPLINK